MVFDTWGLGYSRQGTHLIVHYPRVTGNAGEARVVYGAGFEFDPQPEISRNPDSQRTKLWMSLLAGSGPTETQEKK